jgi:hypothetical protein
MTRRLLATTLLPLALGCGGPSFTVQLIPRNNSGQSGTAQFYDKGDDTEIVIQTQGGTDNGDQLAHVWTGLCSTIGLASGSVLADLEPVTNGRSTTLVPRRLTDLGGGRFHINVQNSADPSRSNRCGDIP